MKITFRFHHSKNSNNRERYSQDVSVSPENEGRDVILREGSSVSTVMRRTAKNFYSVACLASIIDTVRSSSK